MHVIDDVISKLQAVPATLNGMLGGFSNLTTPDVAASLTFLTPFLRVVSIYLYASLVVCVCVCVCVWCVRVCVCVCMYMCC